MRNHTVIIELSLDFKALAQQKLHLLTLREDFINTFKAAEIEAIDGIVNMIDAIQDTAVLQLSEATVFGPNF